MPAPRAAHAMVSLDEKLYVVGGMGPLPRQVWTYDPANGRWDASGSPMPTARHHLAVVVFDRKFAAIGGRWEGQSAMVEIYDPATDTWRRGADMPTRRGGIAAGLLHGRIHVAGGESFDPMTTFDQHEVYDPNRDVWSQASPLPTRRHGLGSVVHNGRWYLVGGATRPDYWTFFGLTDVVEIYSPEQDPTHP